MLATTNLKGNPNFEVREQSMEESLEKNQETNEEVAASQKILIPNGLNNEESVTKGLQDILESHGE